MSVLRVRQQDVEGTVGALHHHMVKVSQVWIRVWSRLSWAFCALTIKSIVALGLLVISNHSHRQDCQRVKLFQCGLVALYLLNLAVTLRSSFSVVSFPTATSSPLLQYQPAVSQFSSVLMLSTWSQHRPTRHHLQVRVPASPPSILLIWRFPQPPFRFDNLQI